MSQTHLAVAEALALVLAQSRAMPTEEVPLAQAFGRVLASDVTSPLDVPPWDNSAMDGYALRAADSGESVSLVVDAVVGAGQSHSAEVQAGHCVAIMTGAPLPPGVDCVIPIENSDRAMEGDVQLTGQTTAGRYVRRRGSDVAKGATVLRAGRVLEAADVGLIASLGMPTVAVRRRPMVAILATGSEIVPPGQPLEPGQIYSSNNITLCGLVAEAGAEPLDLGLVHDSPDAMEQALRRALSADVVLTTGGVSAGVFDHVLDIWRTLGIEQVFWKVRMRPGKPIALGRSEHGVVFGLPGNPVSSAVGFYEFVRPLLRTMLGADDVHLPVVDAIAQEDLKARPGRARFERVRLSWDRGWKARSTGSQSSGILSSLSMAEGLLMVPEQHAGPSAGEPCRVQLLPTPRLPVAG